MILGERFQLYLNCVWCFMHMATIGLFAHHICNSIIHKINTTLRNEEFIKGFTNDGKPKYVISEAALEAVYNRLCTRLEHFHSSYAGFQLSPKYTAHFKNVFLKGKGTFTAGRMQLLMIALPSALRDLLGPEIALLRRELVKDKTAALVDPSADMVMGVNSFLDWFMMARQMLMPVEDVPELQRRACNMKEELQRVFPEKSGEKSASPWNFPKAHAPDHTGSEIMALGTTPYTETQVFETGHKPNVKKLTNLTNRKDQFQCIANHHERTASLSKLNQAVFRHAKFLAEEERDSDSSSSQGSSSDESDHEELVFDQRASRPCELAVKQPLWDMTFDLKSLRMEAEAVGNRRRGRQRIVLAACKPGAPPAPGASKGVARFSYGWSKQFPDLKFLPTQLGHYIYEYLCDKLGLLYLPEPERDLDRVLRTYLVPDAKDRCDIFTFGCIAIRSEHSRGTVRVRARPFVSDSFHGKHPQVTLAQLALPCLLR